MVFSENGAAIVLDKDNLTAEILEDSLGKISNGHYSNAAKSISSKMQLDHWPNVIQQIQDFVLKK